MLQAPPDHITIHSLPDEVLCDIFREVMTRYGAGPRWCRVLWVCRRWSTVGRSAALLWRYIAIIGMPNNSFISASLEYSKNAYLVIHMLRAVHFSQTLSLISAHINRIRGLIITNTADTEGGSLAAFLNNRFPSLEIFLEKFKHPRYPLWIWRPDTPCYPHLQSLTLAGQISIEVAPTAVFPALQTLILGPNENPSFTFPSLVQFLSRHLHIKNLVLNQYKLALESESFTVLTFPPTILRFALSYYADYTKSILSSFTHIPAQVSLFITRWSDKFQMENPMHCSYSMAPMLPHPLQRHLQMLSKVSSLEITGFPSYYTLNGRIHPDNIAPFIKIANHLRPPVIRDAPLQWLANAVPVFSDAPITEVRLSGDIVPACPMEQWMTFLDAFPRLEHVAVEKVAVHGDDTRTGLLEALLGPNPDSGMRCPRLRRLTLKCRDRANHDEEPFTNLLSRVLEMRATQNAKVDELVLLFEHEEQEMEVGGEDRQVLEVERTTWKSFVNDVRMDFDSQSSYL